MDLFALTHQEVLDRIARHCPRAMATYLQCINLSKNNPRKPITFTRYHIEREMYENFTMFKNNLKKLALENLLEWQLLDNTIFITMADIND